ncbi:MAG: STAS domain-containing protein [Acidobacteria bacterium]|nr:STAS domain-containing protein [Acidobacteriota bacterium]
MLNLVVEKIGDVTVIHCTGRIVRSEAAFQLRSAVIRQTDARVVLLDLSRVGAVEGGGLGMVVFLHLWARDHGIQLRVVSPVDGVRQSLERARHDTDIMIAGMSEALMVLGCEPEKSWNGLESAA